jgi:hypothetical protein
MTQRIIFGALLYWCCVKSFTGFELHEVFVRLDGMCSVVIHPDGIVGEVFVSTCNNTEPTANLISKKLG